MSFPDNHLLFITGLPFTVLFVMTLFSTVQKGFLCLCCNIGDCYVLLGILVFCIYIDSLLSGSQLEGQLKNNPLCNDMIMKYVGMNISTVKFY